jgi:hypothetical protein
VIDAAVGREVTQIRVRFELHACQYRRCSHRPYRRAKRGQRLTKSHTFMARQLPSTRPQSRALVVMPSATGMNSGAPAGLAGGVDVHRPAAVALERGLDVPGAGVMERPSASAVRPTRPKRWRRPM